VNVEIEAVGLLPIFNTGVCPKCKHTLPGILGKNMSCEG